MRTHIQADPPTSALEKFPKIPGLRTEIYSVYIYVEVLLTNSWLQYLFINFSVIMLLM